ncbi:secretory calcium-binding phosphoprotein 9 [Denticeps clupeoides]|uniref:secretory calcium-binding phosphoprotein 9 n=1 Tax=Denticeps clupeoides TaxID=299321 RepID=UPI0010A49070|nr:U1 small nuclear ribonucleoprotein C-like [Denticeps clupeoides]
MKVLLIVALTLAIFNVNSGKKLALIAGLNGGILPGVNPGLTPGLTPGLVVGGRLAPAILTGGTGILGLPPIAQVVPGVSPFMMQPQVFPGAPVGFPNSLVPQPQQFPVLPPNGGMPFFGGFPQPGMLPPQQQVAGVLNPVVNAQPQMPQTPPPMRFKRMVKRRAHPLRSGLNFQTTSQRTPTTAAVSIEGSTSA